MKRESIVTISLVIVCIVVAISFFDKLRSPCEKLNAISNDPETISMLFDKLTFYFENPNFLSKYSSIVKYPKFTLRKSVDINHGLDINWNLLDIDPMHATFSYKGKVGSAPLDYRNLTVEDVYFITVGLGYRFALLFEIDHKNILSRKNLAYKVSVECYK